MASAAEAAPGSTAEGYTNGVIRDPDMVRRFEDELIRQSPPNFAENLRIYEALWEHAHRLGALPLRDPLEGIEADIELAEALRVR